MRARVDNNCVICEKTFATRVEVEMSINKALRAKCEKKFLSEGGGGNNPIIPNPIENTDCIVGIDLRSTSSSYKTSYILARRSNATRILIV